ncbi:hypothetical protein B0T10DRAFT_546899 [Thelonectria olida]|uniref:Uncharacterized protein n=1 Tax=Thelonectria olida TaxID=1576542 RepID=A0A9P8W6U1_9HYPO|nr:hypothetical protein B0T10DRAFT_546899 [Thelonectria olida]
MSDQSSSNGFIDVLVSIFSFFFSFLWSIQWSLRFSQLLSILYLPFRLILYPLRTIVNVLLVVFAPAIYVLAFILSLIRSIIDFLASLEPLYSFFGAAAGVGIVAGIIIAVFSTSIASRLGMYDEDRPPSTRPSSKRSYFEESTSRRDSSSTTDLDWQFLDSPARRRKSAVGLLSQTILEEEDDSEY